MPKSQNPAPAPDKDLSASEANRLAHLEKIIASGLPTFQSVGQALAEIQDSKLFRGQYQTFAEYYRDRWQLEKSQVYRLVDAYRIANNISSSPTGGIAPTSERQIRALKKLKNAKNQKAAWEKAVRSVPKGEVTSKVVEAVVDQFIEKETEAAKKEEISAKLPPSESVLKRALDHIEAMTDKRFRLSLETGNIVDSKDVVTFSKLNDSHLRDTAMLIQKGWSYAAAVEDVRGRLQPGDEIRAIHTKVVQGSGKWSGDVGLFFHVAVDQKHKEALQSKVADWIGKK